jgi:WD40 repeat protein
VAIGFDRLRVVAPDEDWAAVIRWLRKELRGVPSSDQVTEREWRQVRQQVASAEGAWIRTYFLHEHSLVVAWWTDYQQRRHLRVRDVNTYGPLSTLELGSDPPLRYIYPDRVFYRHKDGEHEWFVACDCGIAGRPEHLAWMGDCCGPCHDRREERIPTPAISRSDTLQFDSIPVRGLAFDASGSRLAIGQVYPPAGPTYLFVRSIESGEQITLEQLPQVLRALDISPDGEFLAVGTSSRRTLLWTHPDGPQPLLPPAVHREVEQTLFSFNGEFLATVGVGELELLVREGDSWLPFFDRPGVSAVSFSPTDDRIAIAGAHGVEVMRLTREEPSDLRRLAVSIPEGYEIAFVGFVAEGRSIVLVYWPTWTPDGGGALSQDRRLEIHPMPSPHEPSSGPVARITIPGLSVLAVSPDGSTLAWVIHDEQHSPGRVIFWDVAGMRELGGLYWDYGMGMIHEMTFTPDGHTLVTGGEYGTVKFWPWRQLLEA